jgi:hypothetical protein
MTWFIVYVVRSWLSFFGSKTLEDAFTVLAILSAIPGAWLSFKRFFYPGFAFHLYSSMLDNTYLIPRLHKIFGYLMIGSIRKQKRMLGGMHSEVPPHSDRQLAKYDKTINFRIVMWFSGALVFSFLGWYFSLL